MKAIVDLWILDDLIPKDAIYIIPNDIRAWTIYCSESHYDREKETTVLTIKSKTYYFRIKEN